MRTQYSNIKSINVINNSREKSHSFLPLTVFISIVVLVLTSFTSTSSITTDTYPPDQLDAQIVVEFNEYNHEIDTSPLVVNPIVNIDGTVTLLSQTPYVDINLTIDETDNPWNCSVEPNQFTLSTIPVDDSVEEITVTVNAPAGLKNGTEQRVTIIGTWSYIPEVPGVPTPEPVAGEIVPTHLYVTTRNDSSPQPNGNGNGGENGDDDESDDSGWLPGFEGILIITAAVFLILIFESRKRK
jgi:hypothetical protein